MPLHAETSAAPSRGPAPEGQRRPDANSTCRACRTLFPLSSNDPCIRGEDTKRNLKHVKDRAAPAGQFGDEDQVDLAGLRQRQDLLAFGALLLCPGGDFPPDPHDFLASLLGEGA